MSDMLTTCGNMQIQITFGAYLSPASTFLDKLMQIYINAVAKK